MHYSSDTARIQCASWAFTTRRIARDAVKTLLPLEGAPCPGDLVLASVDYLGQHPGLQLPSGRRKQLFPGDEIVVAYGNRYASNQFESVVPETLGPCHLVAGGGIASRAISWHVNMKKGPTQITPIGLLGDIDNKRINLRDYALSPISEIHTNLPAAIAVVGTGMDSGKTQSCAYLVRGLLAAGLRVGYAKITGTGAGGDFWLLKDAGASPVFDFTDAGMATTYMISLEQLDSLLMTLMGHIARENVDAMVLEIADGIFQQETSALLQSPVFAAQVSGILMASQDSMGASAGVGFLRKHVKPPVVAISGIISAAPLQIREAVAALHLPVYDREGLATPENAMKILANARYSQKHETAEARHTSADDRDELSAMPESVANNPAVGAPPPIETKTSFRFLPKLKQILQQSDNSKKDGQ